MHSPSPKGEVCTLPKAKGVNATCRRQSLCYLIWKRGGTPPVFSALAQGIRPKGPYRRRERYGGRSTRLSVPSSFSNELSASTKDDIVYSVRCGTEGMHTSIVSLTKRFVHLKRRESIWFRKCPHTKTSSIT